MPQWGFAIDNPEFAAFYAKLYNGTDYGDGAVFTITPQDDRNLKDSKSVRIFHGFGKESINFKGKQYKVQKEKTIEL